MDAKGQCRIFNIASGSVIIQNLRISYGSTDSSGGAIYVDTTADVTVTNCNFNNNYAGIYGGAIYCNRANLTMNNCNFNINVADKGGAINLGPDTLGATLTNCNFNKNSAKSDGGAVYLNAANTTLTNCNFNNNTAEERDTSSGGAIYNNGVNNAVNYCTFNNNRAKSRGGAIFCNGANFIMNHDIFNNNEAFNNDGGAITFWTYADGATLNGCNFKYNIAGNDGGAIYWKSASKGTLTNCDFSNKNTAKYGGAIYFEGANNITIKFCNFNNNNTAKYYGGAIYMTGGVNNTVNYCNFDNNRASNYGGAIYCSASNSNLTNCNFNNHIIDSMGGAIYWTGANGAVNYCTFNNNKATKYHSGTIYWNGANGAVNYCTFNNNYADGSGAAIYWYGVGGTVSYSTFTENRGKYGAAIYWIADNGAVIYCTFSDNVVDDDGGAVYWKGANSELTNCNFNNNKANNGGAIYWKNVNGTFDYCTFNNNSAKVKGGAVYFENGNLNVSDSKFINNTAKNDGGAIFFNEGDLAVDNSKFTFNGAGKGQALCIENSFAKITDSKFGENHESGYEPAIYNSQDSELYLSGNVISNENCQIYSSGNITSKVTACILDNKTVSEYLNENALIYLTFCDDNSNSIRFENFDLLVGDTKIYNNYNYTTQQYEGNFAADKTGLYTVTVANVSASDLTLKTGELLVIEKTSFSELQNIINNCTEDTLTLTTNYTFSQLTDIDLTEGIVINKNIIIDGDSFTINANYQSRIFNIIAGNVTLKNINLINGNASCGGAVNADMDTLTVINSNFTNNSAFEIDEDGGAINFNGNSLIITDSKFISNRAESHQSSGGAICSDATEDVNITGCEFIDNIAYDNGAISIYSNSKTVISNSIFKNNYAYREIGAISFWSDDSMVDNCYFISNSANSIAAILNGDGKLVINNSHFTDNYAGIIGAIRNTIWCTLILSNCVFEDNDIRSVDNNYGDLYLYNNTINTQSSEIHNYEGNILSPCTAIVNAGTSFVVGDKTKFTAIITDDKGNLIEEGYYVYFNVSGILVESVYNPDTSQYEAYYQFDSEGIIKVDISCPSINITDNQGVSINVTKHDEPVPVKYNATITAEDASYIINYGGKYSITLKDSNSSAVSGEKITFTFNGKDIGSATTDSNGVATIELTAKILKDAQAGKKNLVITLTSDKYNTVSKTVKITVNKEKTTLTAKNKKFKKSAKTKKYTIILKNSKGNAVNKANVTLKVKGKTYRAKTNTKGKAVFKIKKLTKKGKYTATVKYAGSAYYNAVSKKVKIIIK